MQDLEKRNQVESSRDDEIAIFIEELRQSKSLKELALTGSILSDDETLSNLINALDGYPILEKLNLLVVCSKSQLLRRQTTKNGDS
jgi:hypothetical protein